MNNNKYLKIFLSLSFFLFPLLIFSASKVAGDTFLTGGGDIESWFFKSLDKLVQTQDTAKNLGQAIGGFSAILYVGIIGWRMQTGDAEWSVQPLLKPIFIGLILANWGFFINLFNKPFSSINQQGINIFQEKKKEGDMLRAKRFNLQDKLITAIIKEKSENLAKKEGFMNLIGQGKIGEAFGDQIDKLTIPIQEFAERTSYNFQNIIGKLLELAGLLILRFAVYGIFILQKIWLHILAVFGPISIGISLLPGFDDSWKNWIAKYINVSLYGFIALVSLNIGYQIVLIGYEFDISRLSSIVGENGQIKNQALLLMYNTHSGYISSAVFPVTGFLITAFCILMTPTIADTIVSAGGAGIMTKTKQTTSNAIKTTGAGTKLIGAGAKQIGRVGSSIGRSIQQRGQSMSINATRRAFNNSINNPAKE